MKNKALIFSILCCCSVAGWAQNKVSNLKGIVAGIDTLHKQKPAESIYLHLDKPYYAIGDTMRFKAYVLDEALAASTKSGLMYVELINENNRVVKRQTIRVFNGLALGDIISQSTWQLGSYTIRAYTNWMRNWSDSHFFKTHITMVPDGNHYWLVNDKAIIDKNDDVTLSLHFSDLMHHSSALRDIQWSILENTYTVTKNTAKTDADGNLIIKFRLNDNPAGTKLELLAEDIGKNANGRKVTIPVQFNRPEFTDLQFMPEGGSMIAGINNRIGFKAIGEDGLAAEVSGNVVNSKQQVVANFQSTHKGMGSFELMPQAGETYTAALDLPGGTTKTYKLPPVQSTGIALRVDHKSNDSLQIAINATTHANATYYLIALARDKVCYGANVNISTGIIKRSVAANIFPTGIVKWVLLDENSQPVSQRLVYVDQHDMLNLKLTNNKESYAQRDSIGTSLLVTDKEGKPVKGYFSVAVTDDNQVKTFSTDAGNIASYMLLNVDLKGNIEDAGWYFENDNQSNTATATASATKTIALDNLLLTQGWTGYDWSPVFQPQKFDFAAEDSFKVHGQVTNLFGKSVAKEMVGLISTRPEMGMTAETDKDGRFTFDKFPFLDTIDFHLQTKRALNIGLTVDEFAPPAHNASKHLAMPWYVNSDDAIANFINAKQKQQYGTNSTVLREVDIKSNRNVKFGPPYLVLNEEELRNVRPDSKPMDLLQVLNMNGNLSQMHMILLVDGTVSTRLHVPYQKAGTRPTLAPDLSRNQYIPNPGNPNIDLIHPGPYFEPLKNPEIIQWLRSMRPEDIKSFNARKYVTDAGLATALPNITSYFEIPYYLDKDNGHRHDQVFLVVNVNTNLDFGDNAIPPGAYEYRPMPISWPHKFYSPRYTANNRNEGMDMRSTIYWAPDVVTNAQGKASLDYYSADKPGTYTVIVQGTDLNGNIGYTRGTINISPTSVN